MSAGPSTISLEKEAEIGNKMGEFRTLISVMVAASTGRDEMEDKFAELYDTFHEAVGDEASYQRFSSK